MRGKTPTVSAVLGRPAEASHGSRLVAGIVLIELVRPFAHLELPLHLDDQKLLLYSPDCSISICLSIKYEQRYQILTETMHILQFIPYITLIHSSATAVILEKTSRGVQGNLEFRPSTPGLERKPVQLAPDQARPQAWFPSQVGENIFDE